MNLYRSVAALAALALANPVVAQPAVFVSDVFNNRILRVDTTVGGELPPPVTATVALPAGMAVAPNGLVYVTNQGSASITRVNALTGQQVDTISLAGQVQAPGGIAFAANGDIFVSDFFDQTTPFSGTVKRFSPTGAFISTVVAGLSQPSALLTVGNNLYITETNTSTFGGGRLSVFNGTTTVPLVTGAPATGYAGMSASGSTLYYADLLGGAIKRFDIVTNTALTDLVAPGGALNNEFPSGVLVEESGNILVATLGPVNPPAQAQGELVRFSAAGALLGGPLVSNIFGSAIAPVPEPTSLALASVTAAGFVALRRRAKRHS